MRNIGIITIVFILTSTFLTGCDFLSELSVFPSPTPTPPYIHYSPSKKSQIRLEFDYPSYWIFLGEEEYADIEHYFIGLVDPRYATVPTRAPDESHGTPDDYGTIYIRTLPLSENNNLTSRIESIRQARNNTNMIKAINDYPILIDGISAQVLEYQIEPGYGDVYISLMFSREILFEYGDQLYWIDFKVAEKERDGEFEQGYEYFFNSLMIAPLVKD
jgi:hypothetical protein